jgi:hypothetical protein
MIQMMDGQVVRVIKDKAEIYDIAHTSKIEGPKIPPEKAWNLYKTLTKYIQYGIMLTLISVRLASLKAQ